MNRQEEKSMPAIESVFWMACSLFLIWSPAYFVTGDGACHVHNAMAWRTMLQHPNSFYHNFYLLNSQWSPNYFSHIVLALLTQFVKPVVAEKLLLSLFIFLFIDGYKNLTAQLKSGNGILYPMVWVLLFTTLLFQGFYNFILGVAIYMQCLSVYLKQVQSGKPIQVWKLCLHALLLYFTHLFGLLLFLLSVGVHQLMELLIKRDLKIFWQHSVRILLGSLPALVLTAYYVSRQVTEPGVRYFSTHDLFHMLLHGSILQVFSLKENLWATLLVCAVMGLGLLALLRWITRFNSYKTWTWLFILVGILVTAYFFLPENALGGEQVKQRLQWIILIVVSLLGGMITLPNWLRKLSWLMLSFVSFYLVFGRYTAIQASAGVVKEIELVTEEVPSYKTILPLCFDPSGYYHGHRIADFKIHGNHVANAIQQQRELVFWDNYEANTSYFPLKWKEGRNLFLLPGNMEDTPPHPDLTSYAKQVPMDYVLLFDVKPEDLRSSSFQQLRAELNPTFTCVSCNADSSVLLFGQIKKEK